MRRRDYARSQRSRHAAQRSDPALLLKRQRNRRIRGYVRARDLARAHSEPRPLDRSHLEAEAPRSRPARPLGFATDSLAEGSGFEFPVPRCALIANSAALVAPPDSAVRGGSLNGRLTTPIGGGPATARLTRREDRSAQLGRGPKTLVIGYRFLNGSAASAVCPNRSSRVTKSRSSINVMGRFRRSMLSFS